MRRRTLLTALVLFTLQALGFASTAQDKQAYFILRLWPDKVIKYDIAKDEVAQRYTNKHGVAHGMRLSHDKTKLILTTGQRSRVEIVDVKTMELLEEHNFEEAGKIIRVSTVKETPGGTHWYVQIDRVKKELGHFVIEKPEWLLYNIAEKDIEKRMKELPTAIRRGARISPDGKKWHIFGSDIKVLDPETLKEEGKVELSKPLYSGMGAISVRGDDFYDNENPKAYRMMYSMRDPVKRERSLTGMVDIDMENMTFEIEEWGSALSSWRLNYSKDKTLGIGTKSSGERRRQSDGQDPVTTFVTVDLTNGKTMRETRIKHRNGLRLAGISPDAKKIYMAGRGHELVIYDGEHKHLKTIELEGETDGGLIEYEE
jgi:hypothetical protein